MAAWSRLRELESETLTRLKIATMLDTKDTLAQQRYDRQLTEVRERAQEADQRLKLKFLDAGQAPANFAMPLRNMQAEAALFREANLPLLTEEKKLVAGHERLIGAQTVQWEGREVTLPQLQPVLQESDRERRELAWRLGSERQLEDRESMSRLWGQFLNVRRDLAANASCASYRSYRWRQQLRHDYSPEDCFRFQQAIEQEVVPAAVRVYERRKRRLGVDALRP